MIALLFLFAFVFAIYLGFQAVFRMDARDELLVCARIRPKAQEVTGAPDVRAPAREALGAAESIYARVKWAADSELAWLRGNFDALRAAGFARSEYQEAIRLAEEDVRLARHVRGTLSAVELQLKAFMRVPALADCPLPASEIENLMVRAAALLGEREYEKADAKAMESFHLLVAYADQCFERRTVCFEIVRPRSRTNPPGD